MKEKEHILLYKVLFTILIIFVYIIGRNIPLYGVDIEAYKEMQIDAQSVFMQSLSGDFKNYSVFILGLWPYVLSSMIVMLYTAIKGIDKTSKISPKQVNVYTVVFLIFVASYQAIQKVDSLIYTSGAQNSIVTKIIVFLELIAGMLIVIYMTDRNQKYGIGSKTSIFLVNISSGMCTMIIGQNPRDLILPLIIGVVEIFVMLVLETTEKRIAVQRVSIHNIYADKNYIAYKLNPIGMMPLMFASAFFMIPQLIGNTLYRYMPESERVQWYVTNMKMTRPLGAITYIIIIGVLTISFSLIMLNPWKLADGLLKSGDSILDVYAGKPTQKYLVKTVIVFSLVSSIVLGLCVGVPMFLQIKGIIDSSLVMLPSSMMMSTGFWVGIYREAQVYRNLDKYKAFI